MKRLHKTHGQTTVEFSMALVIFMVLFFCMGDMMRIGYSWIGIQYATNRGIRTAKMLPTVMDHTEKASKIRQEIQRAAGAVGVTLVESDITVTVSNATISVETAKDVTLNPLIGIFFAFSGDRSGVYTLRVGEVIRNAEI